MDNMKYNVHRTRTQGTNVNELSENLTKEIHSNRLNDGRDYSKLRLKHNK